MTAAATRTTLRKRLEGLHRMPTLPAALAPLVRYLRQQMEQPDVHKVTDLIAQDKSLAAQCLQMANSPLFGCRRKVDTLDGAVAGLGFQRVSDIAISCGVLNLMPRSGEINSVAFCEHSLGCALVCRHFARKISYCDPSKAYLAGLLHDLGITVNLWVFPKEFAAAFEMARAEGIPLHEAERSVLGFTHCESGRLFAERWELGRDLIEVIAVHHSPKPAGEHAGLVALVELSDLLCRMRGLSHGFTEKREVNLLQHASFSVLSQRCEPLKDFDWARMTFELDSYLDEVRSLVRAIYRT